MDRLVERLKERFDLVSVVVFGSVARGISGVIVT
ncbi:MAG: nucleotidyltransferase domain-containing protein [Candidatus Jordarchaeales archaeon]